MKSTFLTLAILFFINSHLIAQKEQPDNNGINIQELCTEDCMYLSWKTVYDHSDDISNPKWEIYNLEIGLKKNSGELLITGDMIVHEKDMAAIAKLMVELIDDLDNVLYVYTTPSFEFFNDTQYAEPIVFSKTIPTSIAKNISYADVAVVESQLLPYYEIHSNCFHGCKVSVFNEAIKKFKKSK